MAGPRMTKRELQRMETRQRLHDTAIDLFTRKGFTKVSVDDICKQVGVSKGTFYYYFKTKDQVLLEEFLKIDQFLVDTVKELTKKYKSPTRILTEMIALGFEYVNNIGAKTLKVIYSSEIDPARKKPGMASPRRPLKQLIEKLVREGQEQGELRGDVSVETMTDIWIRFYRGVMYEWCVENGMFDLATACRDFTRITVEGMRKV